MMSILVVVLMVTIPPALWSTSSDWLAGELRSGRARDGHVEAVFSEGRRLDEDEHRGPCGGPHSQHHHGWEDGGGKQEGNRHPAHGMHSDDRGPHMMEHRDSEGELRRHDQSEPDHGFGIMHVVVSYIALFIFSIGLVTVCTLPYYLLITSRRRGRLQAAAHQGVGGSPSDPKEHFTHRLFGCFEDINYCLCGCFCPLCRVADSYDAAGIAWFWKPVIAPVITILIVDMTKDALAVAAGWKRYSFHDGNKSFTAPEDQGYVDTLEMIAFILKWLLVASYYAHGRQCLKSALGIKQRVGHEELMMEDLPVWLCCSACAVVQEAREVDLATGAHVGLSGLALTGPPVAAQGREMAGLVVVATSMGVVEGQPLQGTEVVQGMVVQQGLPPSGEASPVVQAVATTTTCADV